MTTPMTDPRRPMRISASDRLALIYSSPGPYVSVYLRTRPLERGADPEMSERWASLRADLAVEGASRAALDAIDARLALPQPEETAAIGVIAASDGRTVVDHALEPPRRDLAVVDTLPYAAPLIEWDQRRVPHLVVVVDRFVADIVTFHPDEATSMDSIDGEIAGMVEPIRARVLATGSRVVVVGGEPEPARALADALVPRVGPACNVVAELDDTTDGLADATVRHVSDATANTTVGYLREFRFLAEHDAAVDGMQETLDALRTHDGGLLLIHDDPDDQRRVRLGSGPTDLSLVADSLAPVPDRPVAREADTARFVDAAIRAALSRGMRIHVIPSTGPKGPDDGAAYLERGTPTVEPG